MEVIFIFFYFTPIGYVQTKRTWKSSITSGSMLRKVTGELITLFPFSYMMWRSLLLCFFQYSVLIGQGRHSQQEATTQFYGSTWLLTLLTGFYFLMTSAHTDDQVIKYQIPGLWMWEIRGKVKQNNTCLCIFILCPHHFWIVVGNMPLQEKMLFLCFTIPHMRFHTNKGQWTIYSIYICMQVCSYTE